jgi:hypothetical protein
MEECRVKAPQNSVEENKLLWTYEESNIWRMEEIT